MPKKRMKIELSTGQVMYAELLWEQAPKTCKKIWQMLPYEDEVLHVKFSGHVFYCFSNFELKEAECSRVHGVCPGDILYNPHVHEAAEHPHEIAFVYGPASMANVAGHAISNLFARIDSEYLETLYTLGIDISRKGVRMIKLSRVEE